MVIEITELLLNTLSADANVRKDAEESLRGLQKHNYPSFLLSLAGEIANEEKRAESRTLAGFLLIDALDPKEQHKKIKLIKKWEALDMEVKNQIKAFLLQSLSSLFCGAQATASQVITKVASIELPRGQWPELFGSLLANIHQLPPHVKVAMLVTLGYVCEEVSICEEVSPDVVNQNQVNEIVTVIVESMNANEVNNEVRLAATNALYNALGFAQAKFDDDMERDHIMSVVCEVTSSPDVKIRQAAFQCLDAISYTYYEKLAPYIQDIFNITAKAVKEDEERVALQAVSFWKSICEEEIEILGKHGGDFTGDSNRPCFCFIEQFLPDLVPLLLETLLKQEEDHDEDEGVCNCYIATAGDTCLGLVAQTVGDDILPLVMPFIHENISKSDWRQREAATKAFGLVLEGPSRDKLSKNVLVLLNTMLTALKKDPNSHVKDTSAWTLSRIFEFLHGSGVETAIVTDANCEKIVKTLLQALKDSPKVAEKACDAIKFLAQGCNKDVSPLSSYLEEIVQSLCSVRENAVEERLRTAASETLRLVRNILLRYYCSK